MFYKTLAWRTRFILLLSVALSTGIVSAKPVMEVGAGIIGFHMPHYLGSDQQSQYVLPFPYLIYRGDILNADRSGLQGYLYNSDKLDLRLSFGGSLPVNSEDNDARVGMDDLQLMAEVGPNLEYQLFKSDSQLLRLDFPLRAAFILGSPFMKYQGWTANPGVYHNLELERWNFVSQAGLVFSGRRYHAYIYDVATDEVMAGRDFYQSEAGYTAARLSFSAKYRMDNLILSGTLNYYNLNHAKNAASPLIKQKSYASIGLYIAWVFYQSEVQASALNLHSR